VHRCRSAAAAPLARSPWCVPAAGEAVGVLGDGRITATKGPIPMDNESKRELCIVTAVALAPIPLLTALAVIAALQ
jgi:hypothetical protein